VLTNYINTRSGDLSIYKEQLFALIEKENHLHYQRPIIITPAKNKPFKRIVCDKKRAIFILHLAGYSKKKLSDMYGHHPDTVSNWIKKCYKEYPKGSIA
jgi:hypothetical protein